MAFYLRSVTIGGFKSFARHTPFEFTPGITALVGPNGSGKSNVVDAIRWCLGEQSVRDLRGHRSEDVIHAGRRRSLGMAEVSLTFETSGETYPTQAELTVTRRLYRSGDSEYLVNGRKSRLRDLTAALLEVGVEAGRNIVVNQGMADAWLSATPVERRALIEQAAGLTGYRDRRDDARQKIAQTEKNVQLVESVLAEIEPRARLLGRQARAVQDRDEAAARLQRRLLVWHGWKCRSAATRVEEARRAAASLAANRATAIDRLSQAESAAEAHIALRNEWHSRLSHAAEKLRGAEREAEGVLAELQRLHEREDTIRTSLNEIDKRVPALQSEESEARRRTEEAGRVLHEVSCKTESMQSDLQRARDAVAHVRVAVGEGRRRASGALARRKALQQETDELQRQIRDRERAGEEAAHRLARLGSALEEHSAEARNWSSALDELREEAEAAVRARDEQRRRADQLQSEVETLRARLDRMEHLHRRVRAVLDDFTQRRASLLRREDGMRQVHPGSLGERLVVDRGWEAAVASALAGWAFTSTSADGRQHFHSLETDEFLVWRDSLSLEDESRWADGVCEGLPPSLSHPLLGTLLVSNDREAEDLWHRVSSRAALRVSSPPIQVVSKSGRCWSATGVRDAPDDDRAMQMFTVRRDLRQIERRMAHVQSRLDGVTEAAQVVGSSISATLARLETVRAQVAIGERTVAETCERIRILELRLASNGAERERLEASRIELTTAQEKSAHSIDSLRATLDSKRDALARLQPELDSHISAMKRLDVEESRLQTTAERMAMQLEILRADERSSASIRSAARRELERVSREHEGLQERRRAVNAIDFEVQQAIDECERALPDLERKAELARAQLEAIRIQEPGSPPDTRALSELRSAAAAVVAEHERALARLAQVEGELRSAEDDARQDLGQAALEAPEMSEDVPTQEEIRKLRARATQYADVDAGVVAEFTQLRERQVQLTAHLSDLRQAVAELGEIMHTADGEMRKLFDQAFTAVNEEFSRVFRVMLRGGEARLELDRESSGIEVHAQLPGKRARSSAAFSGGERALIASALLFGVLQIRPAPFCILDEVDAALDETNVDRYLAVLRDVSRNTQILVVTHNRATMAAADVLYGLTMDGEGVSSPLSIKLESFDAAG